MLIGFRFFQIWIWVVDLSDFGLVLIFLWIVGFRRFGLSDFGLVGFSDV